MVHQITVLLRVATVPWVKMIMVLKDVLLMALQWAVVIMVLRCKAAGVAHRKADLLRVAMVLRTEAMAL